MNVFQKIVFVSNVQKAIEEVKKVLKEPQTDVVYNSLSGGINKIADGLNDIKKEVPATTEVVNKILKAIR